MILSWWEIPNLYYIKDWNFYVPTIYENNFDDRV